LERLPGSIQQAGATANVAETSKLFLGSPDVDSRLALVGDPNAITSSARGTSPMA
jgi:hypothetical protein